MHQITQFSLLIYISSPVHTFQQSEHTSKKQGNCKWNGFIKPQLKLQYLLPDVILNVSDDSTPHEVLLKTVNLQDWLMTQ